MPPQPTVTPTAPAHLHSLLKDATAPAHDRLEQTLALLREPFSKRRLVAVLRGFAAFHAGWEPALAASMEDEAFTAPRRRAAWAADDLRVLGAEADAASVDAWPEAPALCRTRDAALGSLYVMEGSTLGGKVIAARLARASWWPAAGLRYFSPHGGSAAAMWRQTLARIERDAVTPEAVVQGALATFELLQQRLGALLPSAAPAAAAA